MACYTTSTHVVYVADIQQQWFIQIFLEGGGLKKTLCNMKLKTNSFNLFNTFPLSVKTNRLLNKKVYSFEYKVYYRFFYFVTLNCESLRFQL